MLIIIAISIIVFPENDKLIVYSINLAMIFLLI